MLPGLRNFNREEDNGHSRFVYSCCLESEKGFWKNYINLLFIYRKIIKFYVQFKKCFLPFLEFSRELLYN